MVIADRPLVEYLPLQRVQGKEEVITQWAMADVEKAELAVIEEFMPQQLGDDAVKAAIEAIKAELGASSMKDMGKVVAELKARHGSQLDMGKASGLVKAALS